MFLLKILEVFISILVACMYCSVISPIHQKIYLVSSTHLEVSKRLWFCEPKPICLSQFLCACACLPVPSFSQKWLVSCIFNISNDEIIMAKEWCFFVKISKQSHIFGNSVFGKICPK